MIVAFPQKTPAAQGDTLQNPTSRHPQALQASWGRTGQARCWPGPADQKRRVLFGPHRAESLTLMCLWYAPSYFPYFFLLFFSIAILFISIFSL